MRHHFTWILDLPKDKGEDGRKKNWTTGVHVRELTFEVKLASHQTCEDDYIENMDQFLILSRTSDPPLSGLSIDNCTTEVAPSQSRTPGQRPVYISESFLGEGTFGRVDRVVDASTAAIYARKIFREPSNATGKEHRRKEWLGKIRRETRIMREHPHVSIRHPSARSRP